LYGYYIDDSKSKIQKLPNKKGPGNLPPGPGNARLKNMFWQILEKSVVIGNFIHEVFSRQLKLKLQIPFPPDYSIMINALALQDDLALE